MISRLVSTAVLVLLAAGALFAQATFATRSDGSAFLVLGIFWLVLAVANWFIWGSLRDGWKYGRSAAKEDPDLPLTGWFWPDYFGSALRILGSPEPDRPEAAARQKVGR